MKIRGGEAPTKKIVHFPKKKTDDLLFLQFLNSSYFEHGPWAVP